MNTVRIHLKKLLAWALLSAGALAILALAPATANAAIAVNPPVVSNHSHVALNPQPLPPIRR
jgi:hypothetical protein